MSQLAQRASERESSWNDLAQFHWDHQLTRALPVSLMLRYGCIPIAKSEDTLTIAFHNAQFLEKVEELEWQLDLRIHTVLAPQERIDFFLKEAQMSQEILDEAATAFKSTQAPEETSEDLLGDGDQAPLVKLINSLIVNAMEKRSSDIHIETQASSVQVRFRIDGVLYQATTPIAHQFHSSLISRIKVMAQLDIAEKRIPQDGRFKLNIRGKLVDFRVSIMPTIHGEDAVIRILDREATSVSVQELSLESLGFAEPNLGLLRRAIAEPYGMVLVTGPTGSGKTTTLYACLNEIKHSEDKIITIEDPVEYQLQGITQIPVNEKKGLTFALGLRSILRHDPDKLLVGEIRDTDTAKIAIQSAMTGHLVLTTVHANTVLDVVGRFVNMGVDLHNFVSALNCVAAQRLIRMICPGCRTPLTYSEETLRQSGIPLAAINSLKFFSGSGCLKCHGTGYHGRTALSELLLLNDDVREGIKNRLPIRQMKDLARQTGMTFLRQAAIDAFLQGTTTLREINKVTFID
jgi:type IV pilus assembly protein PilB